MNIEQVKDKARQRAIELNQKGELSLVSINVYFDAFIDGYKQALNLFAVSGMYPSQAEIDCLRMGITYNKDCTSIGC